MTPEVERLLGEIGAWCPGHHANEECPLLRAADELIEAVKRACWAREHEIKQHEVMAAELGPGRELDALVAEKVFGRTVFSIPRHSGAHEGDVVWMQAVPGIVGDPWPLSPYSTDIGAAWEVVEAFKRPWQFQLRRDSRQWLADFWDDTLYSAFGLTAPLAICRAALKAVSKNGAIDRT